MYHCITVPYSCRRRAGCTVGAIINDTSAAASIGDLSHWRPPPTVANEVDEQGTERPYISLSQCQWRPIDSSSQWTSVLTTWVLKSSLCRSFVCPILATWSVLPQLCLSPFRCWLHDEVMGPGFEDSCAHYIFGSCVWSILDKGHPSSGENVSVPRQSDDLGESATKVPRAWGHF